MSSACGRRQGSGRRRGEPEESNGPRAACHRPAHAALFETIDLNLSFLEMTHVTSVTNPESLFAQYDDRLLRYLSRAAGEREAARDLHQEAFLRVSRTAIPDRA